MNVHPEIVCWSDDRERGVDLRLGINHQSLGGSAQPMQMSAEMIAGKYGSR